MRQKGFLSLLWICGSITAVSAYAQDLPRIENFSPQGTVKQVRQAAARFSEPMVPFGDSRQIQEPFDVTCPEKGTGRWADDRNWVYDFQKDLPAGLRCEFRLKADVRTLSGRQLSGQKSFAFSTGGPSIQHPNPWEGSTQIDSEQIFVLELDAEATEESVLRHVWFAVEGIRERVGVRIVSGDEKARILKAEYPTRRESDRPLLLIQARQSFPADSKVSLVWGRGVASNSGVPTDQDQTLSFQTRAPFAASFHCLRENPEADCVPITSMSLRFSAPVSWTQAGSAILKGPGDRQWKPQPPEVPEADTFVSSINFKGPFPERAELRIEIPAAMKDDAGRALINADKFPFVVRTDEYPPLAKFAGPFGILEKSDPVVPVTLRNLEPEVQGATLQIEPETATGTKSVDEVIAGRVFRLPPDKADQIVPWLRKVYARGFDDRDRSIFTASPASASPKKFSLPKPNGAKAFEVVGIPLGEPGFYIVELESTMLGAALLGRRTPMFVSTAALVTNLSVHFKWGSESSLVWVTALDSAKPVRDAVLHVRDCNASLLWTGRTDARGIARIDKLPPIDRITNCRSYPLGSGVLVTAQVGNDLAFVHSSWDQGIEPWRFRLPGESSQSQVAVHTIFDRTLLRAGETVHMKHILRRRVLQGFARVPDTERPDSMFVMHAGSDQSYERPLQWDSGGVAETEWRIPQDAKLGTYNVLFTRGGKPGNTRYGSMNRWDSGAFRVQEYRVPLMKGMIQLASGSQISPSDLRVDLTVKYLAGGGASGLPVRLRHQLQAKGVTPASGFEDFVFSNGPVGEGLTRRGEAVEEGEAETSGVAERQKRDFEITSMDLTLDKSGSVRATISDLPRLDAPMELLAELEFRDPNGETQTVSSRMPLWPAGRLVGIKPESWVLSREMLKLYAAVTDLSGKPVTEAPVRVDLFQRKTYSHRKRLVGGFYAYEHFSEVKKIGVLCEGKTDAAGLMICEVKSPVSGNAILQATTMDDSGRTTTAHRETWIAGEDSWWFPVQDHDRMDVLPEKKHYEPGEKARLQVRMPFRSATALITVEREGVAETYVKELSGQDPVIEIPVKGNYAPNVYVSVLAVRGRVTGVQPTATVDLGRPAYKLGIAAIDVGWKAHELKVQLTPDRRIYKVREKAQVKIAVKTAYGKSPPPGSEVALAAVDEGLLELMPNTSWALLDALMGRRGYSVQTSTAQMHVVGKRHFGLKALPQGGGGGRQITRELFDTLLLWKSRVALDSKGRATVEVPLNDSLTSFRIVAVATGGGDLFGTGSASIRSTQDLMILSGLAPVVREGDYYRAQVTVRNATARSMAVQVSATVKELGTLKPVTAALAPGEAKEIGWDVTAPTGVASLSYSIEGSEKGGARDRISVSQKVVPWVAARPWQATLTQLEKDFRTPVEQPRDAVANRGGVRTLFRRSLAEGLEGVASYMGEYPYTCMEQRISRAIALRDDKLWQEVIGELPAHLDHEGLVKYFPSMAAGSEVLTSYLIAVAHEAGWELPDDPRERMESALRDFVEGKITRYSRLPTADLSIRKLAAVEALSRVGKGAPQLLSSIPLDPNLWPTSAVIDWLNILRRVPDVPDREQRISGAEQILRSRLDFQGTTMRFSSERSDRLPWLMVSGDTNAVRLILSLLESGKWREDIPRLVKGALERQTRGAWDLTVANAWGVLAVEKFSREFEKVPVSGASTVTLAGRSHSMDWQASPQGSDFLLPWPAAPAQLWVSHTGAGKPWVTIQSLAAVPLKEPFSAGFRIRKTVTPVEQKQAGRWSRGDIARVRLEIAAQAETTWVVLNDPVPAGSTILGTALGRDSSLAARGEESEGWVWPAFQERSFEAYRVYYDYVPKGEWTVEYTFRLNNSGALHLPPTRVEALYSLEMFGEIPNSDVSVQE